MPVKRLAVASVLFLAVLVLASPGVAGTGHAAPGGQDVIVIFREGTDLAQRIQIVQQAGAIARLHFRHVHAAAVTLPDATAETLLQQHPDTIAIVPDRAVHAHATRTLSARTVVNTQTVPAGVQRIGAAPGTLTWTGTGIGVAVVDTGLDFGQTDLQPLGVGCFTAYVACQDDNGHGTHVGGIIAARNNTFGVVGVASGAVLYAVKVLDRTGSGSDSTIIAGLDWIAEHAATLSPSIRVVNMSLGRPGTLTDDPALRQAVKVLYDRGIVVVVSAGNDPSQDVSQVVPATYPEVMAIASTTARGGSNQCRWFPGSIAQDTASYFTTDGAFNPATGIGVTVSAPGEEAENIDAWCYIDSVGILSTKLAGGTTRMSGTSMAAPHVTGVVALIDQKNASFGITMTAEQVRSVLRSTASRVGVAPLDSPTAGYTFDGQREGVVWAPGAVK